MFRLLSYFKEQTTSPVGQAVSSIQSADRQIVLPTLDHHYPIRRQLCAATSNTLSFKREGDPYA